MTPEEKAAFCVKAGRLVKFPEPMTLRDFFAGVALRALLAPYKGSRLAPASAADQAFAIADAMMEARKGGGR